MLQLDNPNQGCSENDIKADQEPLESLEPKKEENVPTYIFYNSSTLDAIQKQALRLIEDPTFSVSLDSLAHHRRLNWRNAEPLTNTIIP